MLAILIGSPEVLLILFLLLLLTVFWIWILVDVVQNPGLNRSEKVMWIIVVALLHWLGALLYFVIARPKRNLVAGFPKK